MKKIVRVREVDYYEEAPDIDEEVELVEERPKKRIIGVADEEFSFFPKKREKIKAYVDKEEFD